MSNEYDIKSVESILKTLKSEIDAHFKFKKEYDKQLAFDFSFFNFFSIGENKISDILAYFLDSNEKHGQGDLFLRLFIESFYGKDVNTSGSNITREKLIENTGRRIDIYIKLKEFTIAIENKIWADDQANQLEDYALYLKKKSGENYLLIYLNPYGKAPSKKSITEELKDNLTQDNNLKVIGYTKDIIPLLNKWISNCEADNVSYFLKEFKKYIQIKFLGKNTLNMSTELKELIYNNNREVEALVREYRNIETKLEKRLNNISEKLKAEIEHHKKDFKLNYVGPFNGTNKRVFKYSISSNENKIWIQLKKIGVQFYSSYYLEPGSNESLNRILEESELKKNNNLSHLFDDSKLEKIFLENVEIAQQCLKKLDADNGPQN